GKDVVNLLLEDERYEKVTSLVRRKLPLEHKRLNQVKIDFSRMDQWAEKFCASHLFCCLGTTIKKAKSKEKFEEVDYKYVLQAAKLLKKNGGKHFILVSAMGANSKSSVFYNKVKGRAEDDVLKFGPPQVTVVRPSLLLGPREEPRLGEKVGEFFMKPLGFLLRGSLRQYAAIKSIEVARKMIEKANGEKSEVDIPWAKTFSSDN
ncbi:MAG: NAD(P)H-binding protein, partial [Bdellovibrionota bacterium]|nr:NAD(P)H-binding protein [Bdellovibrionota bacterium]